MKKFMFLALAFVLALSMSAVAQDILGPHNVNGHGCASCHSPHSGGSGDGGSSPSTSNNYLWGRDFVVKSYTGWSGNSIPITATLTTGSPLFHTAACLSCHDGAATIVGMSGTSKETVDGVNYAPTYIGNDTAGLANDHPVHVAYTPGNYNWPGTVANGKITWTMTDSFVTNFNTIYGHPASFRAGMSGDNTAYVECGTCHNPHSENRVKQTISGVAGYYPSRFFIRGWYDSTNTASNSATQFCRSCHYSKSNEYLQLNSTTN
jgi:hypothetical protein